MSGLALYLLGPPRFELERNTLELKLRKVLALLVYLAVTSQPNSRDVLTELLFPNLDRSRARSDFRQILSILKRTIGGIWLCIDQRNISLPPREGLWIDVHEFRRLITDCRKLEREGTNSDIFEKLEKATRLYRNDFLSGFYLKDSSVFEDWQFNEQESLSRDYAYALKRLVQICEDRSEWEIAIDYGQRWLGLDPLEEEVHRRLMWLYALSDHHSAAIRQFEKCKSILEKELGVVPDRETEKLLEKIQSRRYVSEKQRLRYGWKPKHEQSFTRRPRPVIHRLISTNQRIPRSKMVVFLFVDIHRSFRLTGSHLVRKGADVASHEGILRDTAGASRTEIYRTTRGIFYAIFPTASAAARAAVNAQISFRHMVHNASGTAEHDTISKGEEEDTTDGLPMVIHAGEAERGERNFFGPAVNRGVCLLDAAHEGQILLSATAAELTQDALPDGVILGSLGSHRLKDLNPPQSIYQLMHPSLIQDFPVLKNLDNTPNNLHVQPTSFIGREKELEDVINLLRRSDVRILTLTGSAGTGKTRLALQAAAALIDDFQHGVFFVDLADLREPTQVIPVIAGILEVREVRGEARPLFEILKDFLKSRVMLLLLDNFEHLLPAARYITELIALCPYIKVLVTSREPLHLQRERKFVIPPLSLPQLGKPVEQLIRYEAVRLFIERSQDIRPDFSFKNESLPTIAEICIRLDGLPLAIELAASRIKILSPHELLQRLGDRLKLLKGSFQDSPKRQQTLKSEIDWSYQLLDDIERKVFERLSVFAGGCSLKAVEEVCSETELSEAEVLDVLESLVVKNLLRRDEIGSETRFWMLETIMEFARMELEESLEVEDVKRCHALYYLKLAEEAESKLHGTKQMVWMNLLERERNNLQEAMTWFSGNGMAEECLRLGIALKWFWYRFGHFSHGRKWLEKALALDDISEPTILRAKALHALGWMIFVQGNWSGARSLYEKSLSLFRKLDDKPGEGVVLSDLGVTERWLGYYTAGTEHTEEAVRIAREVGDSQQIVISLIWAYATTDGKFVGDSQRSGLEEAVDLSRQLGDIWSVSHALCGLGDLLRELGEYREARLHYKEALRELRELKDRWLTAWALEGLGRVCFLDGNYRNARMYITESISLFASLGDKSNSLFLLIVLGMLERSQQNHPRAACLLGAFKALREAIGVREVAGYIQHSPEMETAFGEYQTDFTEQWSEGQAMNFEQAVKYAQDN